MRQSPTPPNAGEDEDVRLGIARASPVAPGLGRLFLLLVAQVFLVGLTAGMTRSALPALAESEFGLPARSPELLATLVIAFGVTKALTNLAAGRLADRLGRRPTLLIGWAAALPIPLMILWAPSWWWIVGAAALLGVNQGFCWTVTLNAKLDLTGPKRRGFVNGINEFAGYAGVACAGAATGALAEWMGGRWAILSLGSVVIVGALALAALGVRETREHALRAEGGAPETPGRKAEATEAGRRRAFVGVCQAGLVEKFVDALVWLWWPATMHAIGFSTTTIGWVVGVYAATWGAGQLVTGPLSDRVGRRWLAGVGMLVCGLGGAIAPLRDEAMWWALCAVVAGAGMAMLYPTLGAMVSDLAPPARRARALGVYRFWRDMGYALGAGAIGLTVLVAASADAGFALVFCAMCASAFALLSATRGAGTGAPAPAP